MGTYEVPSDYESCFTYWAIGMQDSLLQRIEVDLKKYEDLQLGSGNTEDLIPKWRELVDMEPKRFVKKDGSLNSEALRNFRRSQIFVPDLPELDMNRPNLRNFIGGQRRGIKRMLRECLDVFKQYGDEELLRKYPCAPAGNPHIFHNQGFQYTFRWIKHVYSLGLVNKVLGSKLTPGFVGLDIGSSYGIFSSLLKREYAESHHVLADFPEQLMLAHYFLGSCFPSARIAGIEAVADAGDITREFVENYDFVLIPVTMFDNLALTKVDLVSNFASFGEMSRKWFEHYVHSPTFKTAEYFFTANRIESYPHLRYGPDHFGLPNLGPVKDPPFRYLAHLLLYLPVPAAPLVLQ